MATESGSLLKPGVGVTCEVSDNHTDTQQTLLGKRCAANDVLQTIRLKLPQTIRGKPLPVVCYYPPPITTRLDIWLLHLRPN